MLATLPSFRKLDGSSIGDGFIATGDWNTNARNDVLVAGNNATFLNIVTGTGDDLIWLGDITTGKKIKAGGGDDIVRTGKGEAINNVDGQSGFASYTTRTTGTKTTGMESPTLVCFRAGTMIDTPNGARSVETLRAGDHV